MVVVVVLVVNTVEASIKSQNTDCDIFGMSGSEAIMFEGILALESTILKCSFFF